MSSLTDTVLHLHGIAALALVFALPAAESAIFLGFVFPGETAAVLAGVLAYEHRIGLPAAYAAVIAGAIVGDTIGYGVGRRWGPRILQGRLGRIIKPRHVERSREALRRRGGWAVLLGRFTAALRVLVPGFAGMAGMAYRRFVAFNIAGGVIWGAAFVTVGYVAGAGWRSAVSTAGTAGLAALGAVALAVVVAVVVRRRRRSHVDTAARD